MSQRGTFVFRNGELVEKGGPLDIRPVAARSHLPTPYVIGDHLPDVLSHADGKVYSSKSAMRKGYKAAGVVELGNDAPRTTPQSTSDRITKREIREALQKVKAGYRPAPLETGVLPD